MEERFIAIVSIPYGGLQMIEPLKWFESYDEAKKAASEAAESWLGHDNEGLVYVLGPNGQMEKATKPEMEAWIKIVRTSETVGPLEVTAKEANRIMREKTDEHISTRIWYEWGGREIALMAGKSFMCKECMSDFPSGGCPACAME